MGDAAFDLAVVEIGARLPAYFRLRVANDATVEDLTQETLIKAFRSRPKLRDQTRLEAWLFRIAHHTVVDYYRRKSGSAPLPDDLPHELRLEHDDVREVLISDARCYLETLPKAYRDPVHLAEYKDSRIPPSRED